MQVARAISSVSSRESWTALGNDDAPVAPVDRYLAYLNDIERSPNTVKAYAHDLRDWFGFLAERGLDWRAVRLDHVGEFVARLRLPPQARDGGLAALPSVPHHYPESTVNRELSAVGAFYTYAARDGVDVGGLLTSWQVGGGRGGRKPFLHHISKSAPRSRRVIALKVPKKLPRVLTPIEVQAVLDGCERLRDRLLFAVPYDTGMRIGEALGLRHNDIAAAEREVTVRRRDKANGPTLAVAHGGDPAAARWRRHRGVRSSARTRARAHDDRDLRAPHRGRTRGGPWNRPVGSPRDRCGCDRAVAEARRFVQAAGQADGRGAQRIPQPRIPTAISMPMNSTT